MQYQSGADRQRRIVFLPTTNKSRKWTMRKLQNQQGELTPHDLRTSHNHDIITGLIHWTTQLAPFLFINNAKSILFNPN
jgi:hypothetical protein